MEESESIRVSASCSYLFRATFVIRGAVLTEKMCSETFFDMDNVEKEERRIQSV